MDKPAFTRVSTSDVRVIMAIMRILMNEFPCQAVMGWIPVHECPVPQSKWGYGVAKKDLRKLYPLCKVIQQLR
jgi:hypothetical protein